MNPLKTLAEAEAHAAKACRLLSDAMEALSGAGLATMDYEDYEVARQLDAGRKGLSGLRRTMKARTKAG